LPLTTRQLEVLGFVAAGLTNQQIANRLRLSQGTVRRHPENIFQSSASTAAPPQHPEVHGR
jgi:DNA-binding NarL/FixJ family response regulator